MSLPECCSVKEAARFAKSKESWIREALKTVPPVCRPQYGMNFPVEGKLLKIARGSGHTIIRTDTELKVPELSVAVGEQILCWGYQYAYERAKKSSAMYAKKLGIAASVKKVSIKDPISRWGSCSRQGNLMVSWRLIMAPYYVMEYVVAHEVAHLKEFNHSGRFYGVLEGLIPNSKANELWLRRNGSSLFDFEFSKE